MRYRLDNIVSGFYFYEKNHLSSFLLLPSKTIATPPILAPAPKKANEMILSPPEKL